MSLDAIQKDSELCANARALVAPGKGVVALDESTRTCTQRFEAAGVESTPETRRRYRQLFVTAPHAEAYISGAIFYEETIRQATDDGVPFVDALRARGQLPGIKLDTGAKPLASALGETVTEGLDGLRERVDEFYRLGARFAKWRAVIAIGDGKPTRRSIEANAHALARYAALCQEGGLVPIIEPEVLMSGDHDIERCQVVTEDTLQCVFDQMHTQRVMLEALLLKTSMVISGKEAPARANAQEVAERTVATLKRCVPAALPGVLFLSGGQGSGEATCHLNLMNRDYADQVPWPMTFSYARALQQPAMAVWSSDMARVDEAQQAFVFRARLNALAATGHYTEALERAA